MINCNLGLRFLKFCLPICQLSQLRQVVTVCYIVKVRWWVVLTLFYTWLAGVLM
jgi:hypothetical protein